VFSQLARPLVFVVMICCMGLFTLAGGCDALAEAGCHGSGVAVLQGGYSHSYSQQVFFQPTQVFTVAAPSRFFVAAPVHHHQQNVLFFDAHGRARIRGGGNVFINTGGADIRVRGPRGPLRPNTRIRIQ